LPPGGGALLCVSAVNHGRDFGQFGIVKPPAIQVPRGPVVVVV